MKVADQSPVSWELNFAQMRENRRRGITILHCRTCEPKEGFRELAPKPGTPLPCQVWDTGALWVLISLQGLVPLILFISMTSIPPCWDPKWPVNPEFGTWEVKLTFQILSGTQASGLHKLYVTGYSSERTTTGAKNKMRSNVYPKMNQFCKLVVCLWRLHVGPAKRKENQMFGGIAVVKVLMAVEALKQTWDVHRKDQWEACSLKQTGPADSCQVPSTSYHLWVTSAP